MAPRDFSTDGAFAAAPGAIPGVTMNDPGPGSATPVGSGGSILQSGGMGGGGGGTDLLPSSAPPAANPGLASGYGGFGSPAPAPAAPGGIHSIGGSGFGPFATPSPGGNDTPGGITSAPGGRLGMMFAGGGSVPDGSDGSIASHGVGPNFQQDIAKAMDTVDQALAYGRKLHGLPSGDQDTQTKNLAMNDDGFRKSNSIEDRRDSDPTAGMAPGTNKRTNADRVGDKINDVKSGYNPTSQALGINDVPPMKTPYPGDGGGGAEGPGPQGADDETPGAATTPGAIPDDEEAA